MWIFNRLNGFLAVLLPQYKFYRAMAGSELIPSLQSRYFLGVVGQQELQRVLII